MSECIQCGYCCRVRPCPFGATIGPFNHQCRFLEEESKVGDVVIYKCGKYREILAIPGSDFSPAFGSGCSSPLFNNARDRILLMRRGRAKA